MRLIEAAAVLGIAEADEVVRGRLSVNDATLRVESTGFVGDYLKTIAWIDCGWLPKEIGFSPGSGERRPGMFRRPAL